MKNVSKNLLIFVFILGLFLPVSKAWAGTILSTNKYAWSNNVGYINFEQVIVNDNSLAGHAWSANKGFIKFDPALGGVLNDGTGNLSGSAWGEQLGWIDFNNVSINTNGKFLGTATGELVGTITFDCPNFCDVQTDWQQTGSPAGGGGNSSGSRAFIPIPAGPIEDSPESAQAKLIDIKKDGIIDIVDFNTMMVNWGNTVCGNPADMNNDCNVDIFDFNILMVFWGTTYQL